MKYPALQPVVNIPTATPVLDGPYIFPITVGIVVKKAPLAMPLINANIDNIGSILLTGQIANILIAFNSDESRNVFTAPIRSHSSPLPNLPNAAHKLKPATISSD